MRFFLAFFAFVVLAHPAFADMYPDGSNAKLPSTGTPATAVCATSSGALTSSAAGCISPIRVAAIVCNGSTGGTTDVTAAMQAELNSFSTAGGGIYQMPLGKGCIVGGPASLAVPYNVQITCSQNGGGWWPNGDFVANADFLVDPAHGITSQASVLGGRSGVFGCAIIRKGFTQQTTLRQTITGVAAFAGTALTCSGTYDVSFENNLIIGFQTAILAACSRMNLRHNRIDSINGIDGQLSWDANYWTENEVWPFAYAGSTSFSGTQDSPISGVTNSGGKFGITLASAPATPLVNNDWIVIRDTGGTPNASGRWQITVVDPTHFTLNGSTFAGIYTSGGSAFLSSLRTGFGFQMVAGAYGVGNQVFGWDQGLVFTSSASESHDGGYCFGCWIDTYQQSKDPVPVGVLSTGLSANAQYSGYIGAPAHAITMNGTNPAQLLRVTDTYIAGAGLLQNQSAITMTTGNLMMTGSIINGVPANAQFIYIADAAGYVRFNNVVVGGGNFGWQNFATDCPKLTADGVTGPCPFTPNLVGDGTAGVFTYVKQNGSYTKSRVGVDVSIDLQWSTIPTPPTGSNTSINGLPVAPSTVSGSCSIGQRAGLSLSSAGSVLQLGVPVSATQATFTQTSNTGTFSAYAPSLVAANGSVSADCHYLQ
jgi:hypothetical protein